MNTDIHPVHDASKLWESTTSLLLLHVSALSLLLGKLDYDFTRGCLLKFLSFPYCHKNRQKSNNFRKDKNGMNPFSILKQRFETRFTYIYFHWNHISLDAFYFEWNKYLSTKMWWMRTDLTKKIESLSFQVDPTRCFFLPFFGSNVIVQTALWHSFTIFKEKIHLVFKSSCGSKQSCWGRHPLR